MTKCADPSCGADIYKDKDGSWQSERRKATGAAPDGKERRAEAIAKEKEKERKTETKPKREHPVHRKLW